MAKVLWTQKQDVGPSARGAHAIAYDAARQRVVLFGGRAGGGTLQADTWEWDGADWTQVADTGPDARSGHALAYDSNRQRVGALRRRGGGSRPARRHLGVGRHGLDPGRRHRPRCPQRTRARLRLEPPAGRALRRRGGGAALRADTWEWDGTDWTQVADTGPDARSGHALAYDSNRQRIVLFGGEAAGSALRADTWEWDGADWTQVADTGPGPSLAFAMTFGAGATLLFGGVTSPPPPVAAEALSRLSWEWDGAHWTLRQDMGPAPRWGHALAFDSARGRAVLFGGFSALPADPGVADSVLADTWEASLEEIPAEVPGPAVAPRLVRAQPGHGPRRRGPRSQAQMSRSRSASTGRPLPAASRSTSSSREPWSSPSSSRRARRTGSQTLGMPGEQPLGDFPLEAKLGEVSLTAVLHVVPGAAPASLLSFAINPDTIATTVPPGTRFRSWSASTGPRLPGASRWRSSAQPQWTRSS